jgi:flagella basal body P-ring formation protein FlgA
MNKKQIVVLTIGMIILFASSVWADSAQSKDESPAAAKEIIAANQAEFAGSLRKAVESYLASQMPENIADWKLVKMSRSESEAAPKDFDDYRMSQSNSSPNGDVRNIVVEFIKNDKIIKRLSLNCKVEMYADAVSAKGNISRGATITQEMVEVRRVVLESPPSDLYAGAEEVVGRVAERNIQSGKVVRKSHISRVMDIRAGDLVVIVAKNDAVQLTARGIAKKEGAIGEMIPVVNLRSNKKLFAKIVDGGMVEVEF